MCDYLIKFLACFIFTMSLLNASCATPGAHEEEQDEMPAAAPLIAPKSDFDFLKELSPDQFRAVLGLQSLPDTDPFHEEVAAFRARYYVIFSRASQEEYQTDPQANFYWRWGGFTPGIVRLSRVNYSPHSVYTILSNPKHRGDEGDKTAPLVLSAIVHFLDKRSAPDLVITRKSPWMKID